MSIQSKVFFILRTESFYVLRVSCACFVACAAYQAFNFATFHTQRFQLCRLITSRPLGFRCVFLTEHCDEGPTPIVIVIVAISTTVTAMHVFRNDA